jgi:hypothetical protein
MNIGVQDGLLDPKHEEKMGNAIWLFLILIRWHTQKSNFVLGGMPLTYDEISRRSGFPARKVRRWLNRLRKHDYIRVSYTNYKMMRLEIGKPKKWMPKQAPMQFPDHRPQTVNHDRPQVVSGVTENGQFNKICSLRNILKDPPTPRDAGVSPEKFFEFQGKIIAVQMGSKKRLPPPRTGEYYEYYVDRLNNSGYPARVYEEVLGEKVN